MPRCAALLGPLLALTLTGCASGGLGGNNGLGISGAETPPELKAVALAPYALEQPPSCAVMAREIVELDGLLGPDVDVLAEVATQSEAIGQAADRAVMGAVRGAIPYRWVLRWMTQAGKMDRELRRAILAGAARRGYLKGVRLGLDCPPA